MGGGSPSGGGTTTTKADPWSGQQPFLTYGMQQAQDQYKGNQPQYFGGNTVAAQSPNTQAAYDMVSNQVQNNPLQAQSGQAVSDTLQGKYLNSNPYLDATFNTGANQILKSYQQGVNQNNAGFEGGGRYGSGMQQVAQDNANNTLGQNLSQYAANTYNTNYQNERGNQLNAVGAAGAVQNQGLTNSSALGTVGSAQDQYSQNLINANIDKWNYDQNLPANKLGQYMGLIQGNYGGTSSTQTPTSGSSALGGALGGAMSGASMGSAFGPWGAAIGGIGGGLMGAFRSDRRTKTNIKRIGTADNGLPIYLYQYKGHNTPMIGFMSDEVRKVHPDAVIVDASGYDLVRYDVAVMPGAA